MYFRTEAVILSHRDFQEADRILTTFTRDFGKVTVLARGVRRPKSRKSGHVELGNWCKVFIAKGKNLDLLTEVETKRAFGIADFDSSKANKIYHLLELVENLTEEKQKNLSVFILLVNFLKRIVDGEDFNLISCVFKTKLLSALGFFSAKNLKDSKAKKLLDMLEQADFKKIKEEVKLNANHYLKLLAFLDSMIENLTERKLKTVRFLDGAET